MINWSRGEGASHVNCPEPKKSNPNQQTEGLISVGRGSGNGGRPYRVGETLRLRDGRILTVVQVSKEYFDEDGLSFGVGDDEGWLYSAECRLADEDASGELKERENKREKKKKAEKRLFELRYYLREEIEKKGKQPWGPKKSQIDLRGDRIMVTGFQSILYGGGSWFILDRNDIWYVQNNDSDGAMWSANNVSTGGAGAIGWKLRISPSIQAKLDEAKELLALLGWPWSQGKM